MERKHGGAGQKKSAADGDADGTADIEELLGIAMGCMGMSMTDFCRCAPSEFYAVWRAHREAEERRERGAWERMRMECLCTLQPYSKHRLKARDVMVFPWEQAETETAGVKTPPHEELSREEIMERYKRAVTARGLR